ncbi:general secretion pathway protein K [Gammaproteobacteria bacterium]
MRQAGAQETQETQEGIALVLVLWVITLLTTMALAVTQVNRTGLTLVRFAQEEAQARAAGEAGVNYLWLRSAAQPSGLPGAPRVEGDWPPDGEFRPWGWNGDTLLLAVADEGSRVDLNKSPPTLLAGLLEALGVEATEQARLIDAIADWRDGDDLRRPQGAEASDYQAAGLPYGPANRDFQAVEELQLVLGMTASLYQALAPHVTIFSQDGKVNPQYASETVLRAIPGMTAEVIQQILDARREAAANAANPSTLGQPPRPTASVPILGGAGLTRGGQGPFRLIARVPVGAGRMGQYERVLTQLVVPPIPLGGGGGAGDGRLLQTFRWLAPNE